MATLDKQNAKKRGVKNEGHAHGRPRFGQFFRRKQSREKEDETL